MNYKRSGIIFINKPAIFFEGKKGDLRADLPAYSNKSQKFKRIQ